MRICSSGRESFRIAVGDVKKGMNLCNYEHSLTVETLRHTDKDTGGPKPPVAPGAKVSKMPVDLDASNPGPLPDQTTLNLEGLRPVAALCVAPVSIYHTLPGVIAFNAARDARNFPADRPAVYHPPCRAWSAHY